MNPGELHTLLELVQQGGISLAEAAARLRPTVAETADAVVDLDRISRCGFPEVVYARGKTAAVIAEIFTRLQEQGQDCFATLVTPDQAAELAARFPQGQHNPLARTFRVPVSGESLVLGRVVVLTAGTSDRPVAEEAFETARWMGCDVDLIIDVGVAGPQRLQRQLPRLQGADAIVVVAGMEGALPSVVGGYVACPVIAVPTSIGYGANFGGVSALLSMLNSCAANVTVVNIDSGFKGGYVAGMIARRTAARPL